MFYSLDLFRELFFLNFPHQSISCLRIFHYFILHHRHGEAFLIILISFLFSLHHHKLTLCQATSIFFHRFPAEASLIFMVTLFINNKILVFAVFIVIIYIFYFAWSLHEEISQNEIAGSLHEHILIAEDMRWKKVK